MLGGAEYSPGYHVGNPGFGMGMRNKLKFIAFFGASPEFVGPFHLSRRSKVAVMPPLPGLTSQLTYIPRASHFAKATERSPRRVA